MFELETTMAYDIAELVRISGANYASVQDIIMLGDIFDELSFPDDLALEMGTKCVHVVWRSIDQKIKVNLYFPGNGTVLLVRTNEAFPAYTDATSLIYPISEPQKIYAAMTEKFAVDAVALPAEVA